MGSMKWVALRTTLRGFSSRLQSLQRSIQSRRPAWRWAMGGVCLLGVVLLAYLELAPPAASQSPFLQAGRRYGPDDLSRIGRALDHQRVTYHIDDERRISVSSLKREQAEEIVAKLDIGPRLPGELRDQSSASSPWESPHDKELREHQERAKILQIMINDLPGIIGSFVSVNRPKTRLGLQPRSKPTAFVRLATEGDRQLPFGIVQSITTILTGYEEGLTADAITVVDRRGHKYLVAGNHELSALSSNRAREEELSQEILEQLDWIKGVRVTVQLPTASVETSKPAVAQPVNGLKDQNPANSRALSAPGSSSRSTPGVVTLNRGLSLEPDPIAGAVSTTPRAPEIKAPPRALGADPPSGGPGRVWVRVPRSYYYQVSFLPGRKEPPREDLLKLTARTEELVKTGVGLIVPLTGPVAWQTTIDIIHDELPLEDSTGGTSASEHGRGAVVWNIASVTVVVAASLAAVGYWVLLSRRPSSRGDATPRRLRFHVGTASSPAPSERVREFIRRNPEAAVSVLERWTSRTETHS